MRVLTTRPVNRDSRVGPTATVALTFSSPAPSKMAARAIAESLSVTRDASHKVPGTCAWSKDRLTLVFTPKFTLMASTYHTVSLSLDPSLGESHSFSFRTTISTLSDLNYTR